MSRKPYIEEMITENIVIRTFSKDTPEEELKWHWDEEDRLVETVNESDWLFQFDNQLPEKMHKPIFIPAGVIHRAIKGSGDLIVKITKSIPGETYKDI